ncbi:MAG: hypothetical protein COW00_02720 [Bdellovibrio sp. CG12_big_fil_rev_8_21_14_0_65_39_13]|nr:MAG: hypothetical protein COW00_02720 [Bdellovibrio sp. CG12_big_fil_rev_8_21_14_0_65_39_13]
MKILLISLMVMLSVFSFSGDVQAKDKSGKSLEQVLNELGDDAYYEDKPNCHEQNCRHIPYEYETEWLWLSKAEKLRRRVRNVEKRNEWLKNSGKFPTSSEIELSRLAKERSQLEATLKAQAEDRDRIDRSVAESDKKLAELQKKREEILKKKEVLMAQARKLFDESDAAATGSPSLTERITGTNPRMDAEDKKKIETLEATRKQLRTIMDQIGDLNDDVLDLEKKNLGAKTQLVGVTADLERGQKELEAKSNQYGSAVNRLKTDKERQIASVESRTIDMKKEGAEKYAEAKLRELQEKDQLADFIMQDLDSIKKDLKISDLEAKVLVGKIDATIERSLLGRYIQDQMQKTLNAAMDGSCQMAKLCAQHDSISNDTRKKMEPIMDALTKEYMAPSSSK